MGICTNFWFILVKIYTTPFIFPLPFLFLFLFPFSFFFFSLFVPPPLHSLSLTLSLSLSLSVSLSSIFQKFPKLQTPITFSSDVRLTRAWYHWKALDERNNLSGGLSPETAGIRRKTHAAAALRPVAVARRRRPPFLKFFDGFCRGSRGQQKPSRISPIRRSVSV